MDGMTATALLKTLFAELGVNASWKLPCRFDTGCRLSLPLIEEFAQAGVTHLVTVDTGITHRGNRKREGKGNARDGGGSSPASGDGLPPAMCCSIPARTAAKYPNKFLCGAGVAYKLASAVFFKLSIPDPERYLELVAMGTLADLVTMSQRTATSRRGLSQMGRSNFLASVNSAAGNSMTRNISAGRMFLFRIAPLDERSRADGKTGRGARPALCDDATAAPALLDKLFKFNDDRKKRKPKSQSIDGMGAQALRRKAPDVLVVDGEAGIPESSASFPRNSRIRSTARPQCSPFSLMESPTPRRARSPGSTGTRLCSIAATSSSAGADTRIPRVSA